MPSMVGGSIPAVGAGREEDDVTAADPGRTRGSQPHARAEERMRAQTFVAGDHHDERAALPDDVRLRASCAAQKP